MNFDFMIRAHGFEKAAAVEAALKKIGVAYEVMQSKPVANGNVGVKRKRLDKAAVMTIAHTISKHPDWTLTQLAKHCNCGETTISKIRDGVHPLQKEEKKLKAVGK